MIELANGCVCCTLNEDLGTTLHGFIERRARRELPPFERVLIETTGLANAGPIIRIILKDPRVREHYALDKVITTVDAVLGMKNLDLHAESVEQVAVADLLVLTKLDLAENPLKTAPLRERVRTLNRGALILDSRRCDVDVAALIGGRAADALARASDPSRWQASPSEGHHHEHDHSGHHDHDHSPGRHDDQITSFCIVRERPLPRDALERFWRALAEESNPNLLRVKGLVNVEEQPGKPIVIQGVQEIYEEARTLEQWPSEDHRTRIVFIGWMLDRTAIERMLP